MTPAARPRRRFLFRVALVGLTAVFYALSGIVAHYLWARWSDYSIGRTAWKAAYEERGQPVPAMGPREGYGGTRLGKKIPDAQLGWHEPEIHVPGLVEIDHEGLQRAQSEQPAHAHILIVGASVAFGAYASSIQETYFARLVGRLDEQRLPVQITVLATGAWTSENELRAIQRYLPRLSPDVLLLFNGLNDFTQQPTKPENERVSGYLDNMRRAYLLARERDVLTVFVLQPFLPQKKHKTDIETRLLELPPVTDDVLPRRYPELRAGLAELAEHPGAEFIDLSGVFDEERHTTFADIWHFADYGHRLVADALAEPLAGMLRARPGRPERTAGK